MNLRFWGPDVDRDVDDELRFHLGERVEALVARGLDPADARARAVEEFGDVAAVRDGLRAIDRRALRRRGRSEWRAAVAQDVRHALRRLV
ncbi:MAG TPA: permease prefix domain 1-containing protein, partial [Gemmatimonadaceae bacterium]|nr:permease prefix domain 1-containing protein [Gemmatimonadaceae bacterium]